jgi:hypothetical protein
VEDFGLSFCRDIGIVNIVVVVIGERKKKKGGKP